VNNYLSKEDFNETYKITEFAKKIVGKHPKLGTLHTKTYYSIKFEFHPKIIGFDAFWDN
jgi:hypothetical protein